MVQQALGAIRKIEEGMDGLLPIILNMQPTMQEKIAPVREVIVRAARTLLEFRQTLMQTAQRSGMAQGSPVMPVPGPGQQGLGSPAAGPPEMMQGEGGIGG